MKADSARHIRDWIALNKMDVREDTDKLSLEDWKKRTSEFQSYVGERVPSPVGSIFFDSKEYLWTTNSLLRGLRETQWKYLVSYFKKHNKKLYFFSLISDFLVYASAILPILFGAYLGASTSIPFLLKMVCFVVVFALFQFGGLKLARKIAGFLFSAKEKEAENDEFETRWSYAKLGFNKLSYPEQWAKSRYAVDFHASFGPYGRDVTGPYKEGSATYGWKQIKENKFIIVDKATGEEAPLLPGVSPYIKESLFR